MPQFPPVNPFLSSVDLDNDVLRLSRLKRMPKYVLRLSLLKRRPKYVLRLSLLKRRPKYVLRL